jgi:hypothetical protein
MESIGSTSEKNNSNSAACVSGILTIARVHPLRTRLEMANLRHALQEITNQQCDSANSTCQRIINDTSRSKYAKICAFVLLGMIDTYDNEKSSQLDNTRNSPAT